MPLNKFKQNSYMVSSIPVKYKIIFTQIYLTHKCAPTDTTTPGQSGPGSNGNEGILHTTQSPITGVTPLDAINFAKDRQTTLGTNITNMYSSLYFKHIQTLQIHCQHYLPLPLK